MQSHLVEASVKCHEIVPLIATPLLRISGGKINDRGEKQSGVCNQIRARLNLHSQVSAGPRVKFSKKLDCSSCNHHEIGRFLIISPRHVESSSQIEHFNVGEALLNECEEVLCRSDPVFGVVACPNVRVNLSNLEVRADLLQVLMPYARAVLWPCCDCLMFAP